MMPEARCGGCKHAGPIEENENRFDKLVLELLTEEPGRVDAALQSNEGLSNGLFAVYCFLEAGGLLAKEWLGRKGAGGIGLVEASGLESVLDIELEI